MQAPRVLWMRGGKRKESLRPRLWNLNSTSNSPVAPHLLSCQISTNQRQAEMSKNARKHTLRNTCHLRVLKSLLMTSLPISISHRLFWCRYSNSSDIVASSPSFTLSAARPPWRACSQAKTSGTVTSDKKLANSWLARLQDRPSNSHGLTVRLTVRAVNSWSHDFYV